MSGNSTVNSTQAAQTTGVEYEQINQGEDEREALARQANSAKGSGIFAIAQVTALLVDNLADDVIDKAKEIDGKEGDDTKQTDIAELNALTQILGVAAKASTEAVTTVGRAQREGLQTK